MEEVTLPIRVSVYVYEMFLEGYTNVIMVDVKSISKEYELKNAIIQLILLIITIIMRRRMLIPPRFIPVLLGLRLGER